MNLFEVSMVALDRQRVRHSFERHAMEYEAHARVQKQVVDRLAGLVASAHSTPRQVLDIGSGTGMLLGHLAQQFPSAELVGIDLAFDMGVTARQRLAHLPQVQLLTGDAEYLPFAAEAFDYVVSTSTFQWLDTLDVAFAEAYRVLRSGELFTFALFGERTLHELRDSYRAACLATGRGEHERTQRFFCREEVLGTLKRCGFVGCSVISEMETEIHQDVPALLKSIRSIGAGNPTPVSSRGLSERRVMLEMMTIYMQTYGSGDVIPASYEVIYGVGRKR